MTKLAFSTFEERVDWLLAHREFLIGNLSREKIVRAMKRDGLVAPRTYWPDVNLGDEIRQAKIRYFASHNH